MGAGASQSKNAPVFVQGKLENDIEIEDHNFIEGLDTSKETFEESMAKIPRVMDYMGSEHREWRSNTTLKALNFLRYYSGPLPKTAVDGRKSWIDGLQKAEIVRRCLEWWSELFTDNIFEKKNEESVRNFRMVIGILWNCIEISETCCIDFSAQFDGFRTLLGTLNSPLLAPKKLQEDRMNVSRLYLAHACCTIMMNVLMTYPMAKRPFRDADGLPICKKFLVSDLDIIKCKSLLCLAYGINENEKEMILASESLLQYLIKLLADCAAQLDHIGKIYPFAAKELVQGLNQIDVNDANKLLLVKFGILEPLSILLGNPKDEEELASVIQGIWNLAFQEKNKDVIRKIQSACSCQDHQLIIECLQLNTNHKNPKVAEAAKGALWVLNEEKSPMVAAYRMDTVQRDSSDKHVMISYQWHYQPLVARIKDLLKEAGIKIWMDVEQMSGSTLEAMADAVENASVVLICFSETYKNSPSCRTEAEYAFKLEKDIIPLRLEESYNPDGWLGIFLGTKLYFKCHTEQAINDNISLLKKELRRKIGNKETENSHKKPHSKKPPLKHSDHVKSEDSNSERNPQNAIHWTREDVANWLDANDLGGFKTRMKDFDGKILMGLQKMFLRAPTVYYANLREDFDLRDMVQMLKFTNAIEELK